jgi:hydroxymethylbilane synthase
MNSDHETMRQALDEPSVVDRRSSVVGRRSSVVVIGTRGSKLALIQTDMVRTALERAHADLRIEVEQITTKGDVILDRPLSAIGDKGLFVTEIEDALRAGRIDLAVHSAKDLPSELPPDMTLAAFPPREDPRDALVARDGLCLAGLPRGARVGTSSLRRACQLRALRPDLQIAELRGNVDTRLRKLREGQYDAIVLAAAGLLRLGLAGEISEYLDPTEMQPAVSQGILGIETRAGDEAMAALLAPLDDPAARAAASAERAFLARIGGGCQVPLGAYAHLDGATLVLSGMIGALDGRLVRGARSGPASHPAALGTRLAEKLLENGGRALLGPQGDKMTR